jgi:hypothetical protein
MSDNLNLAKFVENLLASWFGSGNEGHISTAAIQQAAGDAGYNPADVQGLDMKAIYQNACEHAGVPADYRESADNYNGPNDVEHVIRQIQQVTEVHNFNQQIFDNSTNVDNSVNLHDVTVGGDFDLTNNPITADDGGVAAGGNATGVATGDNSNATGAGDINQASGHSTLIDGDNYGQANSGDNVAQVNQGTTLVGEPGYIVDPVREPVELSRSLNPVDGLGQGHAPVNINLGGGTQQVADVHGDHNLTNFGSGDQTDLSGSTLTNSAVGHDGVTNLAQDTLSHSQVGTAGHDLSQGYQDDSVHSHIEADHIVASPIDVAGDQDVHQVDPHHEVHPDHILPS